MGSTICRTVPLFHTQNQVEALNTDRLNTFPHWPQSTGNIGGSLGPGVLREYQTVCVCVWVSSGRGSPEVSQILPIFFGSV